MKEIYIIGEIGQNHNGSVDLANLIVDLVSRPIKEEAFGLKLKPMNAVKLTKRDLSEELSDSQMNRIYDSPNSFGRMHGWALFRLHQNFNIVFVPQYLRVEVQNVYRQWLNIAYGNRQDILCPDCCLHCTAMWGQWRRSEIWDLSRSYCRFLRCLYSMR